MAHSKITLFLAVVLGAGIIESKIVLPHKLRYLENMLNADLMSKATRMRHRMDGNSGPDNREWPALGLGLGKYQDEKPASPPLPPFLMNSVYQRRMGKSTI